MKISTNRKKHEEIKIHNAALYFDLTDEDDEFRFKMALDGKKFYWAIQAITAHFRKMEKNDGKPLDGYDILQEIYKVLENEGVGIDGYE